MNRYLHALSRVTNITYRSLVPRMRSVENTSTHAQIGNLTAPFAYLGACFYLSIIHCEVDRIGIMAIAHARKGSDGHSMKSNILKRVGFRASQCIIDR